MKKLRLTQIRSQIGRPLRQKRTLQALRLGRIGKVSELEASDAILGMVAKVSHLIKIEEL